MSNWKTEFQRAFKNLIKLYEFLDWELSPDLEAVAKTYSLFVPYNLALKIKKAGPDSALARQFLPHLDELNTKGFNDPIGDREHSKSAQIIHRYQARALFTPTTVCPVHCRYCFRKNELNQGEDFFDPNFEETLAYLKKHSEISEIIFTGGDPFTLSDQKIAFYLNAFKDLGHIKDIRFHTRYPVIMPERITDELVETLNSFKDHFRTLSIAIHTNHLEEFDLATDEAIERLSGFQLLTQTVLLKGINDNTQILFDLFNHCLNLKMRPYYLHHPDQVKGGMHFYLSLEEGRKIFQPLRNLLPGWALPHYIIDIPEGHGKINAFNPESFHYSSKLISLRGEIISSPEPQF